jgi:trimeric autotransporter adhesin
VRAAVIPLLAVALAIALLAGHGGLDARSAAIVETGVAAAFALAVIAAWRTGRLTVPHPAALTAAAALGAYALLALASEDWSLSPLASRQDALRAASYALAVLAGAAIAASSPQPVRAVLILIGALAGAECAWAIASRAFAAESFGLTGRLQGTVGNANSLAILGAAATIAGLALATRAHVTGLALASLGAFTAFSTSSRAAAVATLVVSVVLVLATDRRPLRRLAAPAALLPAIVLGTWASTFGVFDEVAGAIKPAGAGLVLLALAAVVAGPLALRILEAATRRVPAARRAWAERALVGGGAAALLGLVAAIAASNERGKPAIAGIGHLFSSSSNFRTRWWESGLDAFGNAPWRGTGAGTFRTVETLARDPAHATVSPHDALVAALQGTGVLGGIAVLLAGLATVAALVIGVRRSQERTAAVALALAAGVLLLHGLVDVTWETPVLAVMICLAAGVLPGAATRRVVPAVGYGLAAVGTAIALLVVAGATRSAVGASDATAAASAATAAQSLAQARDALQLEPRAADAHVVAAAARQALGDSTGALDDLVAALRLEPDNYNAWLGAARLQSTAFGDRAGAIVTLRRAYIASGQRRQVRTELNAAETALGLPLTR